MLADILSRLIYYHLVIANELPDIVSWGKWSNFSIFAFSFLGLLGQVFKSRISLIKQTAW